MRNAKEEFLDHIRDRKVLCVKLDAEPIEDRPSIILPVNYTEEEYQQFLKEMDFIYNDGYGGQNLFGEIFYQDNTWSERREYDGSEWWEYKKCPPIPKECK